MEFEMKVKTRSKTESGGDTKYKVLLVSEDGKARVSVTGVDVTLFQIFKKDDRVPMTIGKSQQKTLGAEP
jgi:hypothetical protein